MSDSEQCDQPDQLAHLFVLIHGLWGSANHMITIERMVNDLLPSCTSDKIVCLRPSSFSFWRTYDGLKINSDRVISEIYYEIETLKLSQNLKVDKISIVGYSLGGLIARHVIGSLYESGFFDVVTPVFFTTFATPHVGVEFYKKNIFDYISNTVGRFLFGKTGLEFFVGDGDKLLLQMSDPSKRYFQGLAKFQRHILLANVKNDRTVAFFTSYITEYSPFDKWSNIKIKYVKNLPRAKISKAVVRPKFVDLTRSHYLSKNEVKSFKGNVQEQTSFFRTNPVVKFIMLVFIACIFLPVWIPLVLTTTFWVSIYSMLKIRVIAAVEIADHWKKVKNSVYGELPVDVSDVMIGKKKRDQRRRLSRQESFKGDTSQLTRQTVEMLMYEEERFTNGSDKQVVSDDTDKNESENEMEECLQTKIGEINVKRNDKIIESSIDLLKVKDSNRFPLFTPETKLELDNDKSQIVANLNKLDWIKIPVYIDAWNSHDGIVARRGPKTNPKGTSSIGLWCSILRNHLGSMNEQ
jgi:hypothetical protein